MGYRTEIKRRDDKMASVKMENVSKSWGKVVGLNSLNLDILDGEFLALLGPSGCGKTTALKIIAGLEQPSDGKIHIGERVVNDLSPKERDIAMVFQSYALYPHMTVRDNMAFPLKLSKYPKEKIEERVGETSKILGIEDLLDRKPKELSGGQRQRVALGRAIVRSPTIFLMDEPLSNLDAKLRTRMRVELKKLHELLGKTTIYVTHDQVEAMTMADRIVLLKKGEVQQIGTPLELYGSPENMFVAGFIGSPSMNFIRGELKANGGLTFGSEAFSWVLPPEIAEENVKKVKGWIGKSVVLGVRAESIEILLKKVPGSIEVEVYLVEPMGSELLVTLSLGDEKIMAKAPPDLTVKEEQKVFVKLDAEKVHFFEDGGEAIF